MKRVALLPSALAALLSGAWLGLTEARAACGPGTSLEALGFPHALVSDADAADFRVVAEGDRRWLRARTDGRGALAIARSEAGAASLDLRHRFVRFRLRLTGRGRIGGMALRLGSGPEDYYEFTLPLYSDPLFDPVQAGDWIPISWSFGQAVVHGKPDRRRIRWLSWLLRDDARGPIAVEWAELEAAPEPYRGVLSFTFDDGYASHLEVAARRMAPFGFRGTAYVMPDQIGDQGYLTLAKLQELDRLGWDVASHHAEPLTDWDERELVPRLARVRDWLVGRGFERGAGHLAYPLGRHDPVRVLPAARRVFETARVAGAGPETLPPADRHRLRAVNVLGGTTTPEELGAVARTAIEHRHWAILMFHHLVPRAPRHELEYAVEDFQRGLEAIYATGIEVRPVSEVAARYDCPRPTVARAPSRRPPAAGKP